MGFYFADTGSNSRARLRGPIFGPILASLLPGVGAKSRLPPAPPKAGPAGAGGGSARRFYSWYVVLLLACGYAVHALDRTIIYLLLEPIRHEFSLSDSALGTVTGVAYALPFALAGLPLGVLSDRYSRKRLLAALSMAVQRHEQAFGVLETDVNKRVTPQARAAQAAR